MHYRLFKALIMVNEYSVSNVSTVPDFVSIKTEWEIQCSQEIRGTDMITFSGFTFI